MRKQKIAKTETKQIPLTFLLLMLVAILFFTYFIPNQINYSNIRFLVFAIIFGIIPILIFKIVNRINPNSSITQKLGICALSVLIIGPTFGVFQSYREKIELKKNGVWTVGKVIDKKEYKKVWSIKCSFIVSNEKIETYYIEDEKNIYSIGDRMKIIYSKDCPKINELEYHWKKE